MKLYAITEKGLDKTWLETKESLTDQARFHCESYEDRKEYLPITDLETAIKYFTENGFEIQEYEVLMAEKNTNKFKMLPTKKYEKEKLYHVTFSIHGRYTTVIKTTENNISKIRELAEKNFEEASFGEAKDIEGDAVTIEDETGHLVWEKI